MKKLLCYTGIAATLVGSSIAAELMQVPDSIGSHAVYYVRTKQLDAFSCGYNVLFNAANFETTLGFENSAHRYSVFEQYVMPYVREHNRNPRGDSTSEMMDHLSRLLNLQSFYTLVPHESSILGIAPVWLGEISISFPIGSSEAEIQRRFDEKFMRIQDAQIRDIKTLLRTEGYAVVHFSCYVDEFDDGHAILVSLHQNESGRGLFVFDNMNAPLRDSSQIMRYLEYLIYTFDISSDVQFEPPQLPERWLYLDSPDN